MTQHVGCTLDVSTCWKLSVGQTISNIHSTRANVFNMVARKHSWSVVWQYFYAWQAWLKKLRMEGENEAKLEGGFEGDKRAITSTILYWENWPSRTHQLTIVVFREIEEDISPHQFVLRCFLVVRRHFRTSEQTRWLWKRLSVRSLCAYAHQTCLLRLVKRTKFYTSKTWTKEMLNGVGF